MKARQTLLVSLVATITLTASAAADPDAARQRVAVTSKGVVNPGAQGRFVFTPLQAGALKADSGVESATHNSGRVVIRDGQSVTIQDYLTTRDGKRGSFVVRSRVEYVEAGSGYHVGTNTWKIVSGTGQYAGVTGGGRGGDLYLDSRPWSDRFEGFLMVR